MLSSNIEIFLQNSENGTTYDISSAIESIRINQSRKGQASVLTADFKNTKRMYIPKGSKILVHINGINFFCGYFLENEIDIWCDTQLKCYDQLNYLIRNKASYNMTNKTATEMLKQIASDFSLEVGQCDDTAYKVGNPNNPHQNESLYEIIAHGLQQTLVNTGYLYNLYDDYGYLRITKPSDMVAKNQLKVGSNVFDFKYNGSINKKTYNRVNIYQSNANGQDWINQVVNGDTQKKWGVFQWYAEKDNMASKSNVAGAQNLAQTILTIYNREFKQIHIEAVGDPSCKAGSMVFLDIGRIDETDIFGYQLVDNVTHNLKNNEHRMSIDVLDINVIKR